MKSPTENITLDSGLNLVMVPIPSSQVAVGFFIKAGSRNDYPGLKGVAHFLEHMVFRGTKNRTSEKIFAEMDALDLTYNGSTTAEKTFFYLTGNSCHLKKILDIILDIFFNSNFPQKAFDSEKEVILKEKAQRQDVPFNKINRMLNRKFFIGTTLQGEVVGTTKSIGSIQRRDLINFYKEFYTPENTVMVVCGGFASQPITSIIKASMGKFQRDSLGISSSNYSADRVIIFKNMASQSEPFVYLDQVPIFKQAYISIAFPIYSNYNLMLKYVPFIISVLTSGFSSRLVSALRIAKGLVYELKAILISYSDCGLIVFQTLTNPSSVGQVIRIILSELRRLTQERISKEEMEKLVPGSEKCEKDLITQPPQPPQISPDPLDLMIRTGITFLSRQGTMDKRSTTIPTFDSLMEAAKLLFVFSKVNIYVRGNLKDLSEVESLFRKKSR